MISDLQLSFMSITGFIEASNIVYIATGHYLMIWEYGSQKEWIVYDKIIGNIEKVCPIDFVKIDTPSSLIGLVVVTSDDICLLGLNNDYEVVDYQIHVSIPESSVVDIMSTSDSRVFLSCKDGYLYEFTYGQNVPSDYYVINRIPLVLSFQVLIMLDFPHLCISFLINRIILFVNSVMIKELIVSFSFFRVKRLLGLLLIERLLSCPLFIVSVILPQVKRNQ